MSTKCEINISTIWDIFKVEIVLEAPGGKLTSKSRWGKEWKEGGNFFLISLGGNKKVGGRGQLTSYSISSGGEKYAGHYVIVKCFCIFFIWSTK